MLTSTKWLNCEKRWVTQIKVFFSILMLWGYKVKIVLLCKRIGLESETSSCSIACNDKSLKLPTSSVFSLNEIFKSTKRNSTEISGRISTSGGVDLFQTILGGPIAKANNQSTKKEAWEEHITFGRILGVLGLGLTAALGGFKAVGWINKWFYKSAGMRSIWNGALAAVAIANSIFADQAQKALEKDLNKLNKIVKDFKLIGSIDVATALKRPPFSTSKFFFDNAKADYSKYDVQNSLFKWRNGKGGCRGVGQSLSIS